MERKLCLSQRHGQLHIRYVTAADRDQVLSLLTQPVFFRADELRVAREVLDDSIREGPGGDYQSFVVEDQGDVVGWICFGPTPCTVSTYDIYWIAVARERQRQGIGRAMIEFAESRIRERGGRTAVVETSGRADYEATRVFYLRSGYRETARIPDFYAPGDDKIIFVKNL
jgi:ribosomal protein S18 acetylase RimI-like enzyme